MTDPNNVSIIKIQKNSTIRRDGILDPETKSGLETLLGRSVAERLSERFDNVREFSGVKGASLAKELNLSNYDAERIEAIGRLCSARSFERSDEEIVLVDRLHKLADPMRKVLERQPNKEIFACAYLGERNRLLDIVEIAVGEIHQVQFEFRSIFAEAFRLDAKSLIMAHNHVASSFEPSDADIEATRRAVSAGELVGVPVIDHVIMCPSREEPGCWHFRSMVGMGKFPGQEKREYEPAGP